MCAMATKKQAKKRPRAAAKRKRAKPKPKPVTRTRGRPRQVYLSEEEDRIFCEMLERQGCNASELVRTWLERAQAQWLRRHKPAVREDDPRQMTLVQAAAS
jgi:hypothetical protein